MSIYIFDLDGTIADVSHRLWLIRGGGEKNWDGFFEACEHDQPIQHVIDIVNSLWMTHQIFIWTGRNKFVSQKTEKWLYMHNVAFDSLLMREQSDHRPDHELKKEWYYSRIDSHERAAIRCVFEDRTRVVQMWRSLGVPCLQVAQGDF